ncbi:hypothetical protein I6F30_26760 [Bradyrhizobium sp. NBAIM20]|uniref:hypothetical protein n=1 Tax=unclassified Bradyrhizobium TaxID=2631580 RepID=UPI001CD71860|nr:MULTISPECIES: hypothetical protein [unclassified Bradyrhizobium]MCA1414704.1 hypothetical protein [Bradyrhizobium sp. NBAIM20]MCA1461893.1 hypothetical protein [Bradyrhizobium sp. NBAIM18]
MALIDRVVGKNIPKSPAPESVHPTRTTRVPWGRSSLSVPITPKEGHGIFCFMDFRNERGPQELHRWLEACSKSA